MWCVKVCVFLCVMVLCRVVSYFIQEETRLALVCWLRLDSTRLDSVHGDQRSRPAQESCNFPKKVRNGAKLDKRVLVRSIARARLRGGEQEVLEGARALRARTSAYECAYYVGRGFERSGPRRSV